MTSLMLRCGTSLSRWERCVEVNFLELMSTTFSLIYPGSAEGSSSTAGGTASWAGDRRRGQLQCGSEAAGVSGKGPAQEEQDLGTR